MPQLKVVLIDGDAPDGVFSWDSVIGHAPLDLNSAASLVKPEDLATLTYTSGTSGPPKAVMISHKNIACVIESLRLVIVDHPKLDTCVGKRIISYLPMAHMVERGLSHYHPIFLGYEVTICPEPAQIATYLREVKPHVFFGVPRVWEKIRAGVQAALAVEPERAQKVPEAIAAAVPIVDKLEYGIATEQDKKQHAFIDETLFKKLREAVGLDEIILAITGAAPTSLELQKWFRAVGVPLSESYGLSETCASGLWSPLRTKPGTVGRALPGIEVKLAEDGEILFRDGNVFSGYFNSPDKTAESLDADGWLHTGDIGEVDDEGYLKVVDRKKDLIITAGGKNVRSNRCTGAKKRWRFFSIVATHLVPLGNLYKCRSKNIA